MRPGRTDPRTDAELVALYRSGDAAAGDVLIDRHYGLCLSAVNKIILRPEVEADDLLQDALLALHQCLAVGGWEPEHPSGAKLATYAFRRIRWAVLSGLEAATPRSTEQWHPTDLDGLPAADDAVCEMEALSKLTPLERQAVLLTGGRGGVAVGAGRDTVRLKEVACRLGVTEGRVKELLASVRRKLFPNE